MTLPRSVACWLLLLALVAGASALPVPANAQGTALIVNGAPAASEDVRPGDDVKVVEAHDGVFSRLTDHAAGYSLLYPVRMSVDASLSAVRTVLADSGARIEIYRDDFSGRLASPAAYTAYSNRVVRSSRYFTVTQDRTFRQNGMTVHLLSWSRPKLARIPNDHNCYVSAEFVTGPDEVYTLLIKSAAPFTEADRVIASFDLTARSGRTGIFRQHHPPRLIANDETRDYFFRHFGPDSPQRWGIFEPSAPESPALLHALEARVGYRFPVVVRYQSLEEPLPLHGLEKAREENRTVELTLQTVMATQVVANLEEDYDQPNAILAMEILDGKHDEYLRSYAAAIRDFGRPVLFRLNNEMNGDWCWYSAYYTSRDTGLYTALWRYVHGIFAAAGAENVIWVWNPHDLSRPEFQWNHFLLYYPGDEFVDVVGLTGYNTGNYFPGETWREFEEIYADLYSRYTALFPQPLIISEFASSSVGGDKAAWIERMFLHIRDYDRIKLAVWWSGVDYDRQGRPGRIYLMDEDDPVIGVFSRHLRSFPR